MEMDNGRRSGAEEQEWKGHFNPQEVIVNQLHAAMKKAPIPLPNGKKNDSRGKGPQVLDEDAYVDSLEHIIQRDFFPELDNLRKAELALNPTRADSVRRTERAQQHGRGASSYQPPGADIDKTTVGTRYIGDSSVSSLRAAHLQQLNHANTQNRGAGGQGTSGQGGGGEWDVDSVMAGRSGGLALSHTGTEDEPFVNTNLRLDQFHSRYTSEDNQSFHDLQEKSLAAHRQKFAWAGQHAIDAKNHRMKLMAGDASGVVDDDSRKSLMWNYMGRNNLFYPAEALPDTEGSRALLNSSGRRPASLAGDKTKPAPEVNLDGTRITLPSQISGTVVTSDGNVLPGHVAHPSADPRHPASTRPLPDGGIRGYAPVVTPSPAPGPGAVPSMTWGHIESTPIVLRGDGNAASTAGLGPRFRINDMDGRDLAGQALAVQAHASRTARRQRQRGGGMSPSVRHHLGSSRSARSAVLLSPAAQHLAERVRKSVRSSPYQRRRGGTQATTRDSSAPGQVEGPGTRTRDQSSTPSLSKQLRAKYSPKK